MRFQNTHKIGPRLILLNSLLFVLMSLLCSWEISYTVCPWQKCLAQPSLYRGQCYKMFLSVICEFWEQARVFVHWAFVRQKASKRDTRGDLHIKLGNAENPWSGQTL